MTPKLDYRWNLRQVMASHGMFATTDLIGPLAGDGIRLSYPSQVYRLVAERPERLSLKILMALLDILGCTMEDLVEPVTAAPPARKARTASGGESGIGGLRPESRPRHPGPARDRCPSRRHHNCSPARRPAPPPSLSAQPAHGRAAATSAGALAAPWTGGCVTCSATSTGEIPRNCEAFAMLFLRSSAPVRWRPGWTGAPGRKSCVI